jgi:hypothetical protein
MEAGNEDMIQELDKQLEQDVADIENDIEEPLEGED